MMGPLLHLGDGAPSYVFAVAPLVTSVKLYTNLHGRPLAQTQLSYYNRSGFSTLLVRVLT
jgi:hypothetical protein